MGAFEDSTLKIKQKKGFNMSLGMQLLTTALTVIVTAITTALVNRFLSIPKKWKK